MSSIQQTLSNACQRLKDVVESPQLEAEVLLAHVLNSNRTQLHAWPEQQLTEQQLSQYITLVDSRLKGKPIAYLVGTQGFWSLDLIVTPETLIPRPETELLVELALNKIPLQVKWRIADLGTGSGAVVLALAKERPDCQFIATDNSAEALGIASENARLNKIDNVTFYQSHWFENIDPQSPFEMIVGNPPYIPEEDPHLLQGDLRFEPRGALSSGTFGLNDLHDIIHQSGKYLKKSGWLLLEHGYDQEKAVTQLMHNAGFRSVKDYRDLNQQPRVITGQKA